MAAVCFSNKLPNFYWPSVHQGAVIANSVLAMGWMTEGLEFEAQLGQEFSLFHVVQTGSGNHPDSYPMSSFPGGGGVKVVRAWSWPFTSNYFQGQENVDLYIHSLMRLHGIVLN
jgi:hypothetical protein